MKNIQFTHDSSPPPAAPSGATEALRLPLVVFLAVAAGLGVASLYYSQPLLGVLADAMAAPAHLLGFVPTLTQIGYALGLLLLAPLGDRYDRRRIIVAKATVLAAALLLASMAPSPQWLLLASLVIGLAATMAQDVVPAAATLAPGQHRGKVVGSVMTGLLFGILLSRVVSGFVAQQWGWRTVFVAAAAAIAAVGVLAWRLLPPIAPTTQLPYSALLRSLAALWQRHPALRQAAWAQGLLAIGFSAFWSTLAVMLHGAPFHLGSAAAGAFGLAGAAGALVAPLAGRLADRSGPARVTQCGAALVVLSFASMALAPVLPMPAQIPLLVGAAIGFDLGFQATLIAHQTIVYAIEPAARSRLNALLFVAMFIGMAIGSALGGLLLARSGWTGVTALATAASVAALVLRFQGQDRWAKDPAQATSQLR